MIEIEKKIMLQKREAVNTNVDEFMSKLNYRIETSKTNRQIFLTSSVMVLLILLLTVTQFGAPDLELDNYLVKEKGLKYITAFRDNTNYIKSARSGLGIFEMGESATAQDRAEWKPLIRWLEL